MHTHLIQSLSVPFLPIQPANTTSPIYLRPFQRLPALHLRLCLSELIWAAGITLSMTSSQFPPIMSLLQSFHLESRRGIHPSHKIICRKRFLRLKPRKSAIVFMSPRRRNKFLRIMMMKNMTHSRQSPRSSNPLLRRMAGTASQPPRKSRLFRITRPRLVCLTPLKNSSPYLQNQF